VGIVTAGEDGHGATLTAAAVAREAGLAVAAPRVLADRSNTMVLLAPGGPVARVGGLTARVRDVREHFGRELDLARFLAAAGAPAVRPVEPAGPHERDGRVVTFWELVPSGREAGGTELGAALRACHEVLRGYRAELPPLRALLDEAGQVARLALAGEDRRLVLHRLARVIEELPDGGQALHGDAGLLNALPGPVWNDWEDACVGAVDWDLASLVTTARVLGRDRERAEAALQAAGGEPDPLYVEARALQTAAWSALAGSANLHRRLEWLRTRLPPGAP
jgi:hypothetical protein